MTSVFIDFEVLSIPNSKKNHYWRVEG